MENGADMCVKQPDGCNVLHVAAKYGDEKLVELVKILIESSHLMKMKNLAGKTPIEVVFSKKEINRMKLMIFQ